MVAACGWAVGQESWVELVGVEVPNRLRVTTPAVGAMGLPPSGPFPLQAPSGSEPD